MCVAMRHAPWRKPQQTSARAGGLTRRLRQQYRAHNSFTKERHPTGRVLASSSDCIALHSPKLCAEWCQRNLHPPLTANTTDLAKPSLHSPIVTTHPHRKNKVKRNKKKKENPDPKPKKTTTRSAKVEKEKQNNPAHNHISSHPAADLSSPPSRPGQARPRGPGRASAGRLW